MKRLLQRRWVKICACATAAILAGLAALACYLDVHSGQDVIAYIGMSRECHPVWKDLALRRIQAGQSVAEVVRMAPPRHRHDWNDYTLLSYGDLGDFTGLAMLAEDQRLIFAQATSCCWQHEFFRTIDTNALHTIMVSFWDNLKEKKAIQPAPRPVPSKAAANVGP
jgi:hypothetical protein